MCKLDLISQRANANTWFVINPLSTNVENTRHDTVVFSDNSFDTVNIMHIFV